MTIAELEAASARVAAALAVLKEAGAWAPKPAPVVEIAAPPPVAKPHGPPVVEFSPAERAERDRLLKQMRPELPPDIAALEDA